MLRTFTRIAIFGLALGMQAAVLRAETAAPAGAERTFMLKARRVYTMQPGDDWVIDRGMILVRDGRIEAVGRDLPVPAFVDLLELPDAIVMPGLVSADSGLTGRLAKEDSVGPQYLAIDGFDVYADYRRILAGGVTTVYLNPGHRRLVSGVGAVVKLGLSPEGRSGGAAGRVLIPSADLVINLGEPAFNPPPKRHWLVPPSSDLLIKPSDVQRPTSRLGQLLQLNESFDAALAYAAARSRARASVGDGERPPFDAGKSALAALLNRKVRLRVHADRATDLEQAVRFCLSRKHDFVLTGAIESRLVADELARAGAPIIFEVPVRPNAVAGDLGSNPDRLDDALVISEALRALPIAVVGPPDAPLSELMFYAAAARSAGLPRRKAIEAVTSEAARILGVADRVGSIQPGRDADLLVLNDEPLRGTTHVRRVLVNGRVVYDASEVEEKAPLVVRAGRLWTGDHWIRDGEVLIEDGRIAAVGETAPHPPHTRVVDAGPGSVLTPGFIDARGHLGLEGDRSSAGADLSIARALYRARPEFGRVARAGVTTVLTSTYRPGRGGSRVSAIHTAGENRRDLIVKETAGLIFSLRGQDPVKAPEALRKALAAGKKYDEAWKQYERELAEFLAKGPKKQAEKKTEKVKEEVIVEKPKADPITGTWKGEISGPPLPEAQSFEMKLKLSGSEVTGSVATFFGGGDEVAVSGTYADKHLTLELDVDIPIGKPVIEADLDRDDHLSGNLRIARFSFDLEAERTEKEVPKIKIKRRRKKKTKGGAPEAPAKDEALEPYRALFAGKIALLVDVDSRQVTESILPVFEKEYKVPFALLNAEAAGKMTADLLRAKAGVILPTRSVRRVNRRDYVQSVDLSRAGVAVAFQSDAEDGARHLPDRAAYEVREGLDATTALKALTSDAARIMRCDDEVGVLKPGRRGDLLIFDGPPLEPGSRITRVFINGKEVPR
ncbi:MAG: amidohydrolase family protein [Phycisphaerae bacterium]